MIDGNKTYLVALGFIAAGVGGWLTGEMSLQEAVLFIMNGLGLGALRSGVKKVEKKA